MATRGKDLDLQRFTRPLTAEERATMKSFVGTGSVEQKRKFRETIEAQRLTDLKAAQTSTTSHSTDEVKCGTYRNFWVIAEKEGGLMDR